MLRLMNYLNPMAHIGERRYSLIFPFIVTLLANTLSEVYAYNIARDPMIVGVYIIFVNVALILYFSFRDGVGGGVTASVLSVSYYFYIIYTRHYTGIQLDSGVKTTIVLGILFLILAGIIGWLKQEIDKLVERESDEKR